MGSDHEVLELVARLHHPRVLLWVGSGFHLDPALREDLPRVPLAAVFLETQNPEIEEVLKEHQPINGQYPVALASTDEVQAWESPTLPIFYLRGREGDLLPSRRQEARRAAMLERLSALGESQRPLVIGLGVENDAGELQELLGAFADYDPCAPILILGGDERCTNLVAEILTRPGPHLRPVIFDGDWSTLKAILEPNGLRVTSSEDEVPRLRVGQVEVDLYELFADPELRIDETWRLITTQALGRKSPDVSLNDLFHAFMQLDERREADRVETDRREWWAIGEGIPCPRPGLSGRVDTVLRELQELEKSGHARPRICWLPAEPASGATTTLHIIAYEAAKAGYPVLILKQLAAGVAAEQVSEFLTSLALMARRRAATDRPPLSAVPVLLVLDAGHAGIRSVQSLPDRLFRAGLFRVLTLWSVAVKPGSLGREDSPSPAWLRDHALDLQDVTPHPGDKVLRGLRAIVEESELDAVDAHVRGLRSRGLRLREHDRVTWRSFQNQQRFFVETILDNNEVRGEAVRELRRRFEAEDLYWILLYHFLSDPDVNPLAAAVGRRVDALIKQHRDDRLTRESLGLLLEIARASNWGLVLPQTSLVDWLSAHGSEESSGSGGSEGEDAPSALEPVTVLSSEALSAQVVRLRAEWTEQTRQPRIRLQRSPEARVRGCVELLEHQGLARSQPIGGEVYIRIRHRALARHVLLAALQHADLELECRDQIGGLEAVLYQERALQGLAAFLRHLSATSSNIRLCESVSERFLVGEEDWDWQGWSSGQGETRLAVFQTLPRNILNQSRVLFHHHGLVLRRTTFWNGLSPQVRLDRLLLARQQVEQALSMPWRLGARDDHPSFIRTTLGYILNDLANLDREGAARWKSEARAEMLQAMNDLPGSRHVRLKLAELDLQAAKSLEGDSARREEAVSLAAECLRLLSVEPTNQFNRWYQCKRQARSLFSHDDGMAYLVELRRQGVEDGFLLGAELLLAQKVEDISGALDLLRPLISGNHAVKHHRAARLVAELMARRPDTEIQFAERHRLLLTVESQAARLTPDEEFQLAFLDYQLGHYQSGANRFSAFRASYRYIDVSGQSRPYLRDEETGQPRMLDGSVEWVDANRGGMKIRSHGDARLLFKAFFQVRLFFGDTPAIGSQVPVHIQFVERGPMAVPLRFARGQSR